MPTVADALALPFADDTFTGAYLVGVLPTLPDPSRVLDELHRVLHPTGRLVIADHRRVHWLPPEQVRHLARRHGFAVITQRGRSRYVQVLHPLQEPQQPPARHGWAHGAPARRPGRQRVGTMTTVSPLQLDQGAALKAARAVLLGRANHSAVVVPDREVAGWLAVTTVARIPLLQPGRARTRSDQMRPRLLLLEDGQDVS